MPAVGTGMREGPWTCPKTGPCTPQALCFSEAFPDIPSVWCRANSSLSTFTSPWAVPSSTSASWLHSVPGLSSHSGKPARYAGLGSTTLWTFIPRTTLSTYDTFVTIKTKPPKPPRLPCVHRVGLWIPLSSAQPAQPSPAALSIPPVSVCWLLLHLLLDWACSQAVVTQLG